MSKKYIPEPGDGFEVSYTTATRVDIGMMFELDRPVITYEKQKWVAIGNKCMPYSRFMEQYNVKEFKKI